MRRAYLTCWDYGMGGIWHYILAESPDAIRAKYPGLIVFEDPPAWWAERPLLDLETVDVDDEPTPFLRTILAPSLRGSGAS